MIPDLDIEHALRTYDALLFDAFGVLLDHAGPRPGAVALIQRLRALNVPFLVVTNDASRTPETIARWYTRVHLDIPATHILCSGLLLADYYKNHLLQDALTVVLGPEDSHTLVKRAGGQPIPPERADDASVIALCDEGGYPLLSTLDTVVSALFRRLERNLHTHLLLPNPDLIYPRGPHDIGFAAGAFASILESALELRFPHHPHTRFVRLGKPELPLYEHALSRLGTRNTLFFGDQLATDILGAHRAGIDSVLVSGNLNSPDAIRNAPARPTYRLTSLET